MKDVDFYSLSDYRKLIEIWLRGRPSRGHGERSRLATAMNCHTAYVTHVLKKRAQLSPEQALAAARYMGLSEEETRYFIGLVALDRAGTPELRQLLKQDLETIREQRRDLKTRFKADQPLDLLRQSTFYSQWTYIAVLCCLTTTRLRRAEDIAEALGLALKKVHEVLNFLTESDLAEKSVDGSYESKTFRFHLEAGSPLVPKHHANWRLQALQSLEKVREDDLHYSSVISIHPQDKAQAREILVQAIEKVRALVKNSDKSPRDVCCYNVDLFSLTDT